MKIVRVTFFDDSEKVFDDVVQIEKDKKSLYLIQNHGWEVGTREVTLQLSNTNYYVVKAVIE